MTSQPTDWNVNDTIMTAVIVTNENNKVVTTDKNAPLRLMSINKIPFDPSNPMVATQLFHEFRNHNDGT